MRVTTIGNRLPIPGQDDGSWGTILNGYLSVELNPDGTLKKSVDIQAAKDAAATAQQTATNAQNALATKADLSSGRVPTGQLGGGTASTSTYLRGDGNWTAVGGGTPTAHASTHATAGTDPVSPASIGAAPDSRQIISGTGLTGGGDLTANRTLAVTYGTGPGTAAQGNDSRITGAIQSGATAGGDLSGTLPNPTVAKVNGITVSGAPTAANQVITSTSVSAASWQPIPVAGDVSSNTTSSTDGQVALFNGTTGKSIKLATSNGIPKLTSGVLGAATAGTDYYAPGNTVPITDGGTGAINAPGARTNLGVAIGSNVQAYSANLDAFALKSAPTGAVVGTTDTQTLTNKTLTSPAITGPTGITATDVGLGNVTNNLQVKKAGDTMTGYLAPAVSALTDGVTIAVDASLGNVFTVTLGGNRTINNPTNPVNGQKIVFRLKQDATGSRTIIWDTNYRFSTDLPQPTLTTTALKTDYLGFIYNGVDGKWDCLAVNRGF